MAPTAVGAESSGELRVPVGDTICKQANEDHREPARGQLPRPGAVKEVPEEGPLSPTGCAPRDRSFQGPAGEAGRLRKCAIHGDLHYPR